MLFMLRLILKARFSTNYKCKVRNKYKRAITYGLEESFLSTSNVGRADKNVNKQAGEGEIVCH